MSSNTKYHLIGHASRSFRSPSAFAWGLGCTFQQVRTADRERAQSVTGLAKAGSDAVARLSLASVGPAGTFVRGTGTGDELKPKFHTTMNDSLVMAPSEKMKRAGTDELGVKTVMAWRSRGNSSR